MASLMRSPHPTLADGALMALTSSLGPFACSGYIPAFHAMAEEFHVPLADLQTTLATYLIAFAVSSIFCGPLSDALGRKPVLITGMLVFAISCVGAIFAPTLETLIAWRLLMGLSAGVGQVVTQAVVRDRFNGNDATRMNGMIAMFFAIAPAVAPIAGGAIVVYLSWHWTFVLLLAWALLIALAVATLLPETLLIENRRPMRLSILARDYAYGLRSKALLAGSAAHGCIFMGGIVFMAGGADFVINIMGLKPDQFGWLSLPLVIVNMLGAWSSARLAVAFGSKTVVACCLAMMLTVGVVCTVWEYATSPIFPWLLAAPILFSFAMATARPIMMAFNLDYFPKNRGTAASIQQCCITGGFALSTSLWVPLAMGEAWKYSAVLIISACCATIFWTISMHFRPQDLQSDTVNPAK